MHTGVGCGTVKWHVRLQPLPTQLSPRARQRCLPAGKRLAKMVSTKQIMMAAAAGTERGLGWGGGGGAYA